MLSRVSLLVALVTLCVFVAASSDAPVPVRPWAELQEAMPAPSDDDNDNDFIEVFDLILHGTAGNSTVHVARVKEPGLHIHVFPPVNGCGHRVKTSETAAAHGCVYAVNGGFFDMSNGNCIGNLVSNFDVIETSSAHKSNMGVTADNKLTFGYFPDVHHAQFASLVAGAVRLVDAGEVTVDKSAAAEGVSTSFVDLLAPRTAVGVDTQGRFIFAQADGAESIHKGVNLNELAHFMLHQLNVTDAINLDGGGSSTSVYNGKMISKSTCDDVPVVCERTVTSIVCAK